MYYIGMACPLSSSFSEGNMAALSPLSKSASSFLNSSAILQLNFLTVFPLGRSLFLKSGNAFLRVFRFPDFRQLACQESEACVFGDAAQRPQGLYALANCKWGMAYINEPQSPGRDR
jgi:hypothetical protein